MGNSRSMGWGSLQMRLRYDVCRRMTKNLWHSIEKVSLIEFTQLQSRDPEKIWTESAVSVSTRGMLNCWLHNLWRMLSLKSVTEIVHLFTQFSRKFKICAFVLPSSKKFLRHKGSCLHNNVSRNFSKHCEIQFESPIQSFEIFPWILGNHDNYFNFTFHYAAIWTIWTHCISYPMKLQTFASKVEVKTFNSPEKRRLEFSKHLLNFQIAYHDCCYYGEGTFRDNFSG